MEEKLEGIGFNKLVCLAEFEVKERYNRCPWINNLYLSFDIAFVNKSYGGTTGRVNIIQKVNRNDRNHDTEIAKMMLVVND